MRASGNAARAAVLFDAVGTLIELREPVGETYARAARAHGLELPAWRLDDAFQRVLKSMPAMVFPEATEPERPALERQWWYSVVRSTLLAADSTAEQRSLDALFNALFRHYGRAEAWRARAGAHAVLAQLREEEVTLAVVSNFDHRLPALLSELGLREFFALIALPCQAGVAKPDPRLFKWALTQLDIPAASTVYVGDPPEAELAAARAAGLHAIDVRSLATLTALPEQIALPPPESKRG